MLDVQRIDEELFLILRPNRSLSWRGNQYVLLVMSLWLGGFALSFALMGAWMILPLVGLELLALAAALYYVSWKLSHCEVLHISRDQVHIAKGASRPTYSQSLPRAEVIVHVAAASHPWGAPHIQLLTRMAPGIRIGEFLNQDDCKELLRHLGSARLTTRHSNGSVRVAF
ncbi:DUF2244 domain-containing protein [Gilvimarinus sp. F26214L]|uniref:DUF2244 domain-containing protein n=1 Tax=Gilvimarinus sp. DZF01 TaxID=3461371 RepID=UPI0040461383